jgi:hypothetical protein
MAQSLRSMLTVASNPSGFHVLTALPRGFTFNATEILERIKNWWKWQEAGSTRKLIVDADNARPQTATMINGCHGCQQDEADFPFALLARDNHTNFFTFGDVKRQLSGCSFDDASDLLTTIQEILDGFEKPTSVMVFEEWVRRRE